MAKKMLIDATHPEETRVVVVDGQKVDDFDFESITKRQLAGNIYLAKVTRVEPSLQAAFVEYGGNRHGFLAFAEVHPDYYQIPVADREALLAEEEREEEARRAREDEEADGGKPRRSRERKPRKERTRTRKPKDDDSDKAAAVAGLEVIDVATEEENTDSPSGLEMADMTETTPEGVAVSDDASEDLAETEVATGEPQEDERQEDVAVAAVEDAPESPADETPADVAFAEAAVSDDATEEVAADDADDATPKTMAESTGLDDDEVVTELVGEPASAQTVTADTVADAAPEPAQTEATPETTITDDAPVPEAGDVSGEDSAADAGSEAAEKKPAKPRKRRTRKPKAEQASAEADSDTIAAEPASDETVAKSPDKDGDNDADGDDGPARPDEVGAEDTLEEAAVARTRLRRRYKIQDVIKVRQILLVQVVKEERGNKGAALTTYLSLAGRYCVLMPNTARGGGISRKITNASDRKRLREVTGAMDVPKGMGLIVRTAGAERTKAEIKRDYEFLSRQWEQIRELTLKSIAPTLIYEEGSLIKRSIRDVYSKEIDQILVEGEIGYREAKEYMKMLMPSHAKNVQPYTDQIPLFSRFQVESYLNGMFNPTVQLKSGGYIVIGITEALVAIDVNSGRATKQGSIEETALQTNLEAADEVARQLRLRDLAGLIVIDFIDMDENRNNRSVEKRMKDRLKNDRARIQVGRISAFGLMEMSRQRLRPGMLEATTQPCPHCYGVGLIRSDENLSLSILREVEEEAIRGRADEVTVRAPVDVANYLINHKRPHVAQLEARHEITVLVLGDPSMTSPKYEIERSKASTTRRPTKVSDVISATSVAADAVEDAEVVESVRDAHPEERDRGGRNDRDRDGDSEEGRSRRRRGKRGGRRKRGETSEAQTDENGQVIEAQTEEEGSEESSEQENGEGRSRRRSRGRRRGGRGRRPEGQDQAQAGGSPTGQDTTATSEGSASTQASETAEPETVVEPDLVESKTADPAPEPIEPKAEEAPAPPPEPEEAVAESQPEPEPVLEPAVAAAPAPKPEDPDKPKRRGWWSFGRS